MIVGVGADLVEIERIRALCSRSERFVERVFTADERAYCDGRDDAAPSYAARFAAKEAVMKCLRTGWAEGVAFRHIEVRRAASGALSIELAGRAAEIAARLSIATVHVSVSHTRTDAIAFAVAESPPD